MNTSLYSLIGAKYTKTITFWPENVFAYPVVGSVTMISQLDGKSLKTVNKAAFEGGFGGTVILTFKLYTRP